MRECVTGLAILNRPGKRPNIRRSNKVTVHERIVDLRVQLLLTAQDEVGLRANLPLRELERALLRGCLSIETVDQVCDGRLQGRWIIHFEDQLPQFCLVIFRETSTDKAGRDGSRRQPAASRRA